MRVDDDTLALMVRYCGRDPREPREVGEEPFSEMSGQWSAQEFLDLIASVVAAIPESSRPSAIVELDDSNDTTWLRIRYARLQTAEEVARDTANAFNYARGVMAEERAAYERLKQKFG